MKLSIHFNLGLNEVENVGAMPPFYHTSPLFGASLFKASDSLVSHLLNSMCYRIHLYVNLIIVRLFYKYIQLLHKDRSSIQTQILYK
jgi:hypothetical protein